MGLLDDLKKQAESVREQAANDAVLKKENARAVDLALRVAFQYLNEFARQLNVLRPAVGTPYGIPDIVTMNNLVMSDFHADHRTVDVDGKTRFVETYITLRCSSRDMTPIRSDVTNAKKIRDALWQYSIRNTIEEVRNRQSVVTAEMFYVHHDFPVQVTLEGDHDRGLIKLLARNLNEFGTLSYLLDARRFDEKAAEELAKQILGHPNSLRDIIWKEPMKFTPASEKPVPNYVIHDVPDEPEEPPPKPSLLNNTMRLFSLKK